MSGTQRAAICTIIAKNYVAQARVLADSVAEHHPDIPCHVLIVDDYEGFIQPAEERFEVISMSELGIPDLARFRFKYSVVELCTAVKPFLMEHLLNVTGVEKLVYLDPDIMVTGSLDPVFAELDAHDVLLTPHLDPVPPADEPPGLDQHMLMHGAFNLGFLAVSNRPPARTFLHWFREKLRSSCIIDYARGLFVDQKFADLAVSMFPGFHIVRDPGCNVAVWNAHSRRLTRADDGTWFSNGEPLRFFHFSTYRPNRPRRPGEPPRFEDRTDAMPLFADYGARLLAHDYERTRRWPYAFQCFTGGGVVIPGEARRHFRDALELGAADADPSGSIRLRRMVPLFRLEAWLRHKVSRLGWHFDRLVARWLTRA